LGCAQYQKPTRWKQEKETIAALQAQIAELEKKFELSEKLQSVFE
jgi:hypothetical protein